MNDEEFFEALKAGFSVLPTLFASDVAMSITDKERFVIFKQAETFKLNISEDMPIVKGGVSENAIKTRRKQSLNYPKETFGFPIIAYGVPVVNPGTNNVVGTITYAVSLQKENELNEMIDVFQTFSEELAASSEELSASTQELAANSQNVNRLINETQSSIESMDSIISYIKSIANTTNLLGLNAAIEAARAGEHGKGFNVVAGEIRKLAANSKDSTGQISETLETIKTNINSIVDALSNFSAIGETQAAQAEQIASGNQRLSEVSNNLLKLSEHMSK
ncbi:methyl-accepting chemotaxis protein [Clostridium sp.]|uniref:methyl-accepting chemotaxis protein n=1 Tax=Clostridium sp. TaxID=1506 RepID=UPI0037C0D6AC